MTTQQITTGVRASGLAFAHNGEWKVVRYAEGGCSIQRMVKGIGWILADDDDDCPKEVITLLYHRAGQVA